MLFDPNWKPPVEIKLEPWQEVLLKAAELLEKEGWIQGDAKTPAGYCAVGAMYFGSQELFGVEYEQFEPTYREARRGFQRRLGENNSIPHWNDAPDRTKEEVITAMRKAANIEKERDG